METGGSTKSVLQIGNGLTQVPFEGVFIEAYVVYLGFLNIHILCAGGD